MKNNSKCQFQGKLFKRLFFDIETSPNIVLSWRVGRKISIDYGNIVSERSIICIAWKWAGEKRIHALAWDKKQNDKTMLKKFIQVMEEADEIIGHNSDKFDIKWIRARAMYHRLSCPPDFVSIDTLKLLRSGFLFNSNRLDYIGKILGVGGKLHTGGFPLWKKVLLDNNQTALAKMVKYCKVDVDRLEKVFDVLKPYVKHKTHRAVLNKRDVVDCPECSSSKTVINHQKVSAAGYIKVQLRCKECGKYFTLPYSKVYPRGRFPV